MNRVGQFGVLVADHCGLTIPVGHSASSQQSSSLIMRYRTGGMPRTVIIDRNGTDQFNDYHLEADNGVTLIDRLLGSNDE